MKRREPAVLLALGTLALAWSGIAPHDRFTWFLEVAPILVGAPILFITFSRFPLTPLAYRLIFVHALILMLGGHYTYAEVPLGFWMQKAFGFARNHYDRIGHFAQGVVPAILVREVLRRKKKPLPSDGWLFFLVSCVCLAISACYEFVEWGTAVATGAKSDAFLGTQGDPWDTQWDMLWARLGSVVSQLSLTRLHERELARLSERREPGSA